MEYDDICLILTEKCTAACQFCGLKCSPQKEGVMSPELARTALDQAKAAGIRKRVALSGGEVFLYPELARDIMAYAKELGFEKRTIASNGFWGAWPDEKICDTLGMLSDCTWISFSYDPYHAQWIEEESLWRAADFAAERGIQSSIHIADVRGENNAISFLHSLSDKAFFRGYMIYPLLPSGRGAEMEQELFIRDMPLSEIQCLPGSAISVAWDGTVYPCCHTGVFQTDLAMGNLNESPLEDMLRASRAARLVRLFQFPRRFAQLADFARTECGLDIPEKVVSGCEVCSVIFQNTSARLQAYLDEAYEKMLVDVFFGVKGV